MSYKTAMKRKKPSAPMKYLFENHIYKKEEMLDYGCGYGFDADYFGMKKYDIHYFPGGSLKLNNYDIITCNYVLNVVKNRTEAMCIIMSIQNLLKENGVAYLTVRRDSFNSGKTSKGYQWVVKLNLPSIYKRSGGFEIFKLTKNNDDVKIGLE